MQFPIRYRLDISEAMLQAAKLRKVFETMKTYGESRIISAIEQIQNANDAMARLQKYSAVDYGHVSPTTPQAFPQKEYTAYAKLTRNERRKMLAHVTKTAPLKRMTYEQARLYHRLRGRL